MLQMRACRKPLRNGCVGNLFVVTAAGPLFDGADSMSFFNLELADTNVVVRA